MYFSRESWLTYRDGEKVPIIYDLVPFLSNSGCVDKFVHRSNCVNELNMIKLAECHQLPLTTRVGFLSNNLG